ncbi:beta strand repeat-containing protein, partial [Flavobacterium sp. RHBU_3]|uniref:beta strand repeat-containing protein n=1 Tax=Flavobacterium sp. RHBU_3 TaxID=3391184 RepID=UPI0039853661
MEKIYANVPRATILARLRGYAGQPYGSSGNLSERTRTWVALLLFSVFSIAANAQTPPLIVGASNITVNGATINWVQISGTTYTVEVYTDSAYTNLFSQYTNLTSGSVDVESTTSGATYYYRISATGGTTYTTGSFVAVNGTSPLIATGYNQDVVANGTGVTVPATTTASVDNPTGYSYHVNGFQGVTYGLPQNRSITYSGVNYLLQPYCDPTNNANNYSNALRLASGTAGLSGTLTLAKPVKLQTLYLAEVAGGGNAIVNVTVLFDDGSTQTTNSITFGNWDGTAPTATPAIVGSLGRANRSSSATTGATSTGNFQLFQLTIPIEVANQTKYVTGVTITKADTSNVANIFAVSGKMVDNCATAPTVTAAPASSTSALFSFAGGSWGLSGGSFTLEVYTDSGYTTPVTGSPFTGITTTSQTVSGLTLGTTYYYRVKSVNGTCDSGYVTGSVTVQYCTPTVTSTTYNITSVVTTGAYNNINHSGGTAAGYNNYTSSFAAKAAGESFNYTIVKSSTLAKGVIYVDWNQDLDFDDAGETMATNANGSTTWTGSITIPAGTAIGDYRMRIRTTYYSGYTLAPCGAIYYGETEDYTIKVVNTTPCTTPDVATGLALSAITTTGMTGTITPAATTPTGYLVVRSTSSTLSAAPANNTIYSAGATLGGGTIVYSGTAATFTASSLNSNTNYYFFVYSYNYDSSYTCLGPVYSTTSVSANKATCVADPLAVGASNVKNDQANLNWTSSIGGGSAAVTYDAELYSDSGYTTLVSSSTGITGLQYAVTGLTANATYYWRVKVNSANCTNGTWVTGNFVAQNSYTPIDVSGYSYDVIANGVGAAVNSTTNAVDDATSTGLSGYAYMSNDYKLDLTASAITYALPLNRVMNSAATSGLKFFLGDYDSNNSLKLGAQNETGLLTFVTPVKLTDIYLAVTGGSGAPTMEITVNFEDGTSQSPVTSATFTDWYGSGTTAVPALISSIGRVNRSNGAPETGASKIFQVTIPILAANQGKKVVSVQLKKTSSATGYANMFAISGKAIGDCPTMNSASGHGNPGFTTGTVEWVLGNPGGTTASAVTYTVEVYTDAAFTTPISGSPFTNVSGSSYTFSGLSADATYYYKVKAGNGICESGYVTGSFYNGYCTPASTSSTYYISNFATTGGYTNISNTSSGYSTGGYGNFTAQSLSASTVTTPIGFSASFSTGTYGMSIWVDWNNDLDFADSGEQVFVSSGYNSSYNSSFAIPAGTAVGNYRMRVLADYYSTAPSNPCAFSASGPYGEAEDYTLQIVEAPAACETPATVADLSLTPSSNSISGTVTPDASTPTGYIIVRSTAATLSAGPVNNTSYAAGASLGGGTVIYNGTTLTFNDTGLSAGTNYYYYVYAYNNGGISCSGPVYGAAYTSNKSTCTGTPAIAGASNIKNNQAIINWASVLGTNVTYTLEVYTDSGYTSAISGSPFTTTAIKYALTGLTANQTYYFRVKAAADGVCESGYGTGSFVAQNSYTPIDITGFNADVIANGTGIANLSTTNDVDGVGNAYMSLDYKNSSTASAATYGLPVNRLLTSSSISGLKFIIPDYNGNNSLRLNGTTPSGTVTLTT